MAAPEPLIEELAKANRVVAKPVPLGRVGLGIVRPACGSPAIDVSTAPALRAALLAAQTVVYNRASSGQGIEALIMKLGLTEQLASRTVRFPDAESVMRHMMSESAGAIGFGAPTAISLYTGAQLQYAGPVPADSQSYTSYAIIATRGRDTAGAGVPAVSGRARSPRAHQSRRRGKIRGNRERSSIRGSGAPTGSPSPGRCGRESGLRSMSLPAARLSRCLSQRRLSHDHAVRADSDNGNAWSEDRLASLRPLSGGVHVGLANGSGDPVGAPGPRVVSGGHARPPTVQPRLGVIP